MSSSEVSHTSNTSTTTRGSKTPWQRLYANPTVWVSASILAVIISSALIGPSLFPHPEENLIHRQFQAPSLNHPFGTDIQGKDMLIRLLEGARISLMVGVIAAGISLVIGVIYGMVSGYVGGVLDSLMMRVVDILYSLPRIVLVIVVIAAFDLHLKDVLAQTFLASWIPQSRLILLFVVLGMVEWLTMARIVRGQVLSLKQQTFVQAARALGQSHIMIMFCHLLPNLIGIVLVYLTLTIPAVVLEESFLSFLGLGVQAPQASWGTLLSEGASVINPVEIFWWLLIGPAIFMGITLLALNFLGDALRDAFDPRSQDH